VTQDFFGTASFAIVANETYARGVRHFFEDEMGLPCTFSVARKPGEKTDNESIRQLVREKPPLVMYGSYNERMYLAEAGSASPMKPSFITASFPGAIIRRHIGTPFMGYSGATYLIQEFCNCLFDALFNILPLGTEMDRVDPTPVRAQAAWDDAARELLNKLVAAEPVLVQISAAKQIRDRAERDARRAGEDSVSVDRVVRARESLRIGEAA
jgi:chlorophyllide a reductase subunit Z